MDEQGKTLLEYLTEEPDCKLCQDGQTQLWTCPQCAREIVEANEEETKEALGAIEALIWQFGVRGVVDNQPVIHTGGYSALEQAFEALGWDDPRVIEEANGVTCDVEGCFEAIGGSGVSWEATGYWHCCYEHIGWAIMGGPQPPMKVRAVEREASRDKETRRC